MREIATLNQMFSTAIMHQSEQIEKLYSQASRQSVGVCRRGAAPRVGEATYCSSDAWWMVQEEC